VATCSVWGGCTGLYIYLSSTAVSATRNLAKPNYNRVKALAKVSLKDKADLCRTTRPLQAAVFSQREDGRAPWGGGVMGVGQCVGLN
jgi:hypothetical protein